jgi:uncharacterized NAD(P)/FAD-binding protein YdhS
MGFRQFAFMKSIAIIGAGFSGTALAVQLLLQATRPLDIYLINRSRTFARGLAYGTQSPFHLLNVPAGRMSLFTDQPGDFLSFAQLLDSQVTADSFVSRQHYGRYLEMRLNQARTEAADCVHLHHMTDNVLDLSPGTAGARLQFEFARPLQVDVAVLATGNFAPATPQALSTLRSSKRYINDPWQAQVLHTIPAHASVLLLGTGLTMIDAVLSLQHQAHTGPLQALSRHGLLPQQHQAHHGTAPAVVLPNNVRTSTTTRKLTRHVRQFIGDYQTTGGDWRDAIAALRPITAPLWQQLNHRERARFLRHVKPYWEVHRHRSAPEPAQHIQQLVKSGRLNIMAGRALSISDNPNGITLTIRQRGRANAESLSVDYLLNCTGPQSDIRQLPDTLCSRLVAQGLIQPDNLGLGVRTDAAFRPVTEGGQITDCLRVLGPLLKADRYESTAVPELRVHATELSQLLLAD